MKTFILFFIGLFLQAVTVVGQVSSATVHVIIFAESDSSQDIYASCQQDARLIKEELRLVEKYANMRIKYYPTSFTKNSFKEVMAKLNCNSDDVIFFYYSGHGYNNSGDFPSLNFNESSFSSLHINLEDVHSELKTKGARLTLSIGDCCNQIKGKYYIPLTDSRKRRLQYISLYKLSKGDVLVASSKKGQLSYGYNNGAGGYFTLSFLKAMHKAIESGNADWEYILKQAQKNTMSISENIQQPYFEVNTKMVRVHNTYEN